MSKISKLPLANTLRGDELVPVVQGDQICRTPFAALSAPIMAVARDARDAAETAANYRSTFSAALADFSVGEIFHCDQTGEYRRYVRTDEVPGYADKGEIVTANQLARKIEYGKSDDEAAVGLEPADLLKPYGSTLRFAGYDQANLGIQRRYQALYGVRGGALVNSVHPLGNPYFNFAGRGTIDLERGIHDVSGDTIILERFLGGVIQGEGCIATTLEDNRTSGATFQLNIYRSSIFRDLAMVNRADNPGTSIGILAVGDNGGQNLGVDNVEFVGYEACIQIGGGNIGNGDTTLVTRAVANHTNNYLAKIVDPSRQSIIHTYIQPTSSVKKATWYTDAGAEVVVLNGNLVAGETVIEIASNGGANNCRWMTYGLKVEYGYGPNFNGKMQLVNSAANSQNFGRGCYFDFQDVSFEGGQYQPANRDEHRIMDLGRVATTIRMRGGKVPGKIRYDTGGAVDLTKVFWSFRDMERSPTPEIVNGQHPFIEWEGNADRPDHYRGGDRGNRSAKTSFVYYWRNVTTTFIHTGLAGQNNTGGQFGSRYGYVAKIATGLPPGTEILKLGAKIKSYGGLDDTRLELLDPAQAADPNNANPATIFTTTIPAGRKTRWLKGIDLSGGAQEVPEPATVDASGDIYVRITVARANYTRIGALAFEYNPVTFD